jgi:hypothetical protein
MAMKTKNRLASSPCENSLIVTPLSVEDCISKIEDMANFDQEVNIVHQSKYNAEIEFVERHNDDIPMYITSRLMASQNGTCVTFEFDQPTREKTRPSLRQRKWRESRTTTIVVAMLMTLLIISVLTQFVEGFMVYLCLAPIIFFVSWLQVIPSVSVKPANYEINTDKVRRLKRQRAEALKGDLYDTLHIDPSEAHRDELGNEYYIDLANHEGESSS